MRRADRLFHIVQILRRGKVVTAAAIGAELEVSERTIYRDLDALSATGVPIRAEAGIGYLLEKGFDVPPLMFKSEELEALVIAARMLAAWADPETRTHIQQAQEKIEQALPIKLREKPARVRVFAPGYMTEPSLWQALPLLRTAINERKKCFFHYRDEKGAKSKRQVRPLAVFFWGKVWTCVAWCEQREDFRHFRLDRMTEFQLTLEHFVDEPGKTLVDFEATLDPEHCPPPHHQH